jgi:type I restriction enzyme R subunit
VHRIVSEWDAAGWRPSQGDLDRYGREIPDSEYQTVDFERAVALKARTEAIARNISEFLKKTDRFAKTIVFCVDQEHADEMRRALNNLNDDLVKQYPDYVCRITSDEGSTGKGYLSKFQELETISPVIVTTSQVLTTGVDIPTCKNIVLARVVGSMVEFKQIIGRGTRVRDDYDKYYFNILDYTGSATRLFADRDFDGEPAFVTEQEMSETGETIHEMTTEQPTVAESEEAIGLTIADDSEGVRRKFYFDGGHVEIAAHLVYELDPDGRQLRVVRFSEYAAEKVRTLYPSAAALRKQWADPMLRAVIITKLEDRGIDFDQLRSTSNQPEADPFDLLCHVAFNAPLRTRRERAERLRKGRADFWERFKPEAREILQEILDKYIEHGTEQFKVPDILKVHPISVHGNVLEIVRKFGDAEHLRKAIDSMQNLLYREAA